MLGLGTAVTSIDSGQIYKELSELDQYASLDIWFDKKISEKIELEPIKKVLKSELC